MRNDDNNLKVIDNSLGRAALLAKAKAYGASEAIEEMEAEGQRQLASQISWLPTEGLVCRQIRYPEGKPLISIDDRLVEQWKAIGVVPIGPVEDDDIFWRVDIPKSWEIRRSEHPMSTALYDDQGRQRAYIFYKAAFYDRRAYIRMIPRFTVDIVFVDEDYEVGRSVWVAIDNATRMEVFRSSVKTREECRQFWSENNGPKDPHRIEVEEWVQRRHPEYLDPTKYWD